MNTKVYKWCTVPLCRNTSIATPEKLFVYVPNKKEVRDKWLKLARRDPSKVKTKSPIYFCEDHFDLGNDMENYMRYHVMGSVAQVRMKRGCMPSKFECQPDRKKQTSNTSERLYVTKKRKMVVLEECENQTEDYIVTEHFDSQEKSSLNSGFVDMDQVYPPIEVKQEPNDFMATSDNALIPQLAPKKEDVDIKVEYEDFDMDCNDVKFEDHAAFVPDGFSEQAFIAVDENLTVVKQEPNESMTADNNSIVQMTPKNENNGDIIVEFEDFEVNIC